MGKSRGERLGRASMMEVLLKHPEIAQAMQEAFARPGSQSAKASFQVSSATVSYS
jgi:hypothetical protein